MLRELVDQPTALGARRTSVQKPVLVQHSDRIDKQERRVKDGTKAQHHQDIIWLEFRHVAAHYRGALSGRRTSPSGPSCREEARGSGGVYTTNGTRYLGKGHLDRDVVAAALA